MNCDDEERSFLLMIGHNTIKWWITVYKLWPTVNSSDALASGVL